jgi:uncharacterized protein
VPDPELAGALHSVRRELRRIGRIVLGVFFIVLGVLGLFLPILQGLLFLAFGALLLAPDVPVMRRLVVYGLRRWPKVRRKVPQRIRRMARRDRR